ncbi:DUF4132 domain-containing protein [Streptomyces sp. NPDC049040]|uniref:DUF4132 domain-containing protein n=1 Tax=Streptomyces sp. NPDC049040 TaxID=3365593 RepID=UPI00371DA2DD
MASPGEHVVAVRRLAAAGDVEGLACRLADAVQSPPMLDHSSTRKMLACVAELTTPQRLELVERLSDRHDATPPSADDARYALLLLAIMAARGLDADPLPEERAARLAEFTGVSTVWHDHKRPDLLAEAEIAAGRTVPADAVAVMRRTAACTYPPDGLPALLRRLPDPPVNAGEEWSDDALATAALLGDPWPRLLRLAAAATAARPSPRWEKDARALIDRLGADAVQEKAVRWLGLAGRPRPVPFAPQEYGPDPNTLLDPFNANALRGLAWLLALLPPDPAITRALGALVDMSLRKVPGHGPRNPKLANAGVLALARCEGGSALGEIARLASRVTFRGTLKQLDLALEARAAALGLSREEVEELAVPAYGLTEVGLLRHEHGELAVRAGKTVLSWRNAAGKEVRGIPAAVRRDHPEEVAELKAAAKDIDRMLTAQAERLDRQFLARRQWAYEAWRERCLDHPLVGTLARRLLWTVDGRSCGYAEGQLRTLAGAPVPAGSTVELWHPVDREPAEVVAWRDWLERHAITQPFKQAHREVYLLTDAERGTRTYSNRFAAHILRQHQFQSLAAVRGWTSKLRLAVDDCYPPAVRELPQWGLRAEFWIEGAGEDDLTESGSFRHLTTDQVRFHPLDEPVNQAYAGGGGYHHPSGGAPADGLPLDQVPALVLSEVLRDVDLFVGVASVGNDPAWQDGGPQGRYRDYWQSFGFGDLTQTAQGRRDLLSRLVPRLAIADRCSVEGRFLHVRGDLHTYRIHLGSGNILISPHDRYLCIVPKSGPGTGYDGYLPFEGDRTLSLILSKALMLSRDREITDRTILSQL